MTGAQAAKPVSPVNQRELPPCNLDVSHFQGVPRAEPLKLFSDNQLILHFSQLVKAGQIKEASQFLADNKESLGNSKNAVLLRSIYLNSIRFGSLDLVEALISSRLRPPTVAMRVSLLKYALWKRETAIADRLIANDFETDQFADVALGSVDRLKLALKEPAAIDRRDEKRLHLYALGRRYWSNRFA